MIRNDPGKLDRLRSFMTRRDPGGEAGKAKTGILLWLLGVPIPIILLIWLLSGGC